VSSFIAKALLEIVSVPIFVRAYFRRVMLAHIGAKQGTSAFQI